MLPGGDARRAAGPLRFDEHLVEGGPAGKERDIERPPLARRQVERIGVGLIPDIRDPENVPPRVDGGDQIQPVAVGNAALNLAVVPQERHVDEFEGFPVRLIGDEASEGGRLRARRLRTYQAQHHQQEGRPHRRDPRSHHRTLAAGSSPRSYTTQVMSEIRSHEGTPDAPEGMKAERQSAR